MTHGGLIGVGVRARVPCDPRGLGRGWARARVRARVRVPGNPRSTRLW